MKNRKRGLSLGHMGLFVLLLAGVWLLLAPTWVGFSSHVVSSRVDELSGAALIVISVVAFLLQWIFGLTDLIHRHERGSADS